MGVSASDTVSRLAPFMANAFAIAAGITVAALILAGMRRVTASWAHRADRD
jgi:hypothetical protein